jgi:hypothetical protein
MMARRRIELAPAPPAFSREWWLGGLRSVIWLVVVTVLIWVYADMEFTDTATISSVTLTLNTNGNPQVALLSEREQQLTFEIAGSQTSIDAFRRQIEEAGSVIRYDVSRDFGPGKNVVPTRELLANAVDLRGITVESTDPDAIEFEIDPVVTIPDVPVELDATGAKIDPPPEMQTVSIQVPKSRWDQVKMIAPKLKTQVKDLSRFQAGTYTIRAEIHPFIDGVRVTPNPASVAFEVQIVNPLESVAIRTTVDVLCPAAWTTPEDTTWHEYELLRDPGSDWRPELQIVGPRKNLTPENVTAYVRLTDDDKKPVDSWLEREVKVNFPPDTDLQLQGPAPKVRFKMQKRPTTPAGPVTP